MLSNKELSRVQPRPPRILHVRFTLLRGGAEEHVLSLASAAHQYGFEAYLAGAAPLLETMAQELEQSGVHQVPIELPTPSNWLSFAAKLAATLRREKIDLVHCHSVIATLCVLPIVRACGKIPIVETCHGREYWRIGKAFKGSFWIDRQASRLIDRIIAVSEATAQFLQEEKGIATRKIEVIHNGRDLTSLMPATALERERARSQFNLDKKPTLLMLGRLSEEKGHAVLLDSLKLLRHQGCLPVVMFAGAGPLEEELRARCSQEGLDKQVRFLGYRPDLQRVLAATDLVVMPSISEGLPLAAIEALGAGLPVIATNTGGIPEVVIDDRTGLLVPCQDPERLSQAILRVLSDKELAQRLGREGRRFVELHFDVRIQVERTMKLYSDVMTGRVPSRYGRQFPTAPPGCDLVNRSVT